MTQTCRWILLALGCACNGEGGDGNGGTTDDQATSWSDDTTASPTAETDTGSASHAGSGEPPSGTTGTLGSTTDTTVVTDETTDPGECVPSGPDEAVCDGLDDDCNGVVDDVDVNADGVYDCLKIALLGKHGGCPNLPSRCGS